MFYKVHHFIHKKYKNNPRPVVGHPLQHLPPLALCAPSHVRRTILLPATPLTTMN